MPLPLLFVIVAVQGQTAPSAQAYSSPFSVAEPSRIALTPKIDGTIEEEEWDALSSSAEMKSFFQWEPGKIHIAAEVPTGHDLVASFDLNGNGWLIGKDNLEIRVTGGATPKVSARLVDATGVSGPKWIDLSGFAMSSHAASSMSGATTTIEATIVDQGLGLIPTQPSTKLMIRMDDPASGEAPAPAYLPRSLSPITLVLQRSAALPTGLKFNAEGVGHASVAGEGTKIRLTFNGSNAMKIKRLEMRSEGFAKNDTNQLTVPFPKFDEKSRSYVDYMTTIAEGSPDGYRVLKATLVTADNVNAVLESSYRVGPVLDFEVPRVALAVAPIDRWVRFAYYAKSNTTRRVTGEVTISVPEPLRILNGATRKINILTNRGRDRQPFDIFFPANSTGTFPIRFSALVNGKKMEQVQYVTVGGL